MPRFADEKKKAEAFRLRYEERLSTRQIAKQLGISKGTLSYWFSPRTRETAKAKRGTSDRPCRGCKATFTPTHGAQRYCPACKAEREKPKPRKPRKARPKKRAPKKRSPNQKSMTVVKGPTKRRLTRSVGGGLSVMQIRDIEASVARRVKEARE